MRVITVIAIISAAVALFVAGLATVSQSRSPSGEPTGTVLTENFRGTTILEEESDMERSPNPKWWLNSGALLNFQNGYAQTNQGNLTEGSKWQAKYAATSAEETNGGKHPQNLFRLVTRTKYRQLQQQAYFRIDADNLSSSASRNASNGLLLFNRYQDGDNLYYTGLRVDGHAVIKKKFRGAYHTLAEKAVFAGQYHRDTSPDLLPKKTWIGIRSAVVTDKDGSVRVQLWSDLGKAGDWQLLLDTRDSGSRYGDHPITGSGYAGIRTDFMDASFRDYQVYERVN